MKYIVLQLRKPGDSTALELPFVFPEACVHAFVAAQLTAMLKMQYPKHTEVTCVGAGMMSSMTFSDAEPHGKSDSLGGIASRGNEDKRLLMMSDYGSMHVDV